MLSRHSLHPSTRSLLVAASHSSFLNCPLTLTSKAFSSSRSPVLVKPFFSQSYSCLPTSSYCVNYLSRPTKTTLTAITFATATVLTTSHFSTSHPASSASSSSTDSNMSSSSSSSSTSSSSSSSTSTAAGDAFLAPRRRWTICQLTDLHYTQATMPTLQDLLHFRLKRLLGFFNLKLTRRGRAFDEETRQRAFQTIFKIQPDLVLLSGDLTSGSLDAEFMKAFSSLAPILQTFPTLVIPGNHDIYVHDQQDKERMETFFGPFMYHQPKFQTDEQQSTHTTTTTTAAVPTAATWTMEHFVHKLPALIHKSLNKQTWQNVIDRQNQLWATVANSDSTLAVPVVQLPFASTSSTASSAASSSTTAASSSSNTTGNNNASSASAALSLLLLDPCRPNTLRSSGNYPSEQLAVLSQYLSSPLFSQSFLFLASHYPLLHFTGTPYELKRPQHAVDNNRDMIELLAKPLVAPPSTSPPPIWNFPHLYVHGHVHAGYHTKLHWKEVHQLYKHHHHHHKHQAHAEHPPAAEANPSSPRVYTPYMLHYDPGSSSISIHLSQGHDEAKTNHHHHHHQHNHKQSSPPNQALSSPPSSSSSSSSSSVQIDEHLPKPQLGTAAFNVYTIELLDNSKAYNLGREKDDCYIVRSNDGTQIFRILTQRYRDDGVTFTPAATGYP